jgi:hypothetical protein
MNVQDLQDIVDITLKNLPKPTVSELLVGCSCMDEQECDIVVEFLKNNYTPDEIAKGLEDYAKSINTLMYMFGPDVKQNLIKRVVTLDA